MIWRRLLGLYREPDIRPGPWFKGYMGDWCAARGVPPERAADYISSAILEGTHGWIWATATPTWDQEWFNKRGESFPARWVPFHVLEDYRGQPGEIVRLDV